MPPKKRKNLNMTDRRAAELVDAFFRDNPEITPTKYDETMRHGNKKENRGSKKYDGQAVAAFLSKHERAGNIEWARSTMDRFSRNGELKKVRRDA